MEEKPVKKQRVKIELIRPDHIVDVWRLVMASIKEGNQQYPDTTEDNPDAVCSSLFLYMTQPRFGGLIAKIGKKPVAIILGDARHRDYGRPLNYAFIWCFWVDPKHRKSGIGLTLWQEFSGKLKKAGLMHWESHMSDALFLAMKDGKIPVNKFLNVVGGRF